MNLCEKGRHVRFYTANNDGKLVICFDKFEVAAGSEGSPEFIIPAEVIADIDSSDLIH